MRCRLWMLVASLGALAACADRNDEPTQRPARAVARASALSGKPKPPQISPPAANRFTTFETEQVRPLALSSNGKLLLALNTPDNRLEVFRINQGGSPTPLGSVTVGLEPIALAVRSQDEVWVLNH